VAAFGFEGAFEGHQIVFVDGRLAPGLSSITPEGGLQIRSLGDVLSREPERLQSHLGRVVSDAASSFADLNAAFFEDGAFVFIPPGLAVDEPIHLVFMSSRGTGSAPAISHPRTVAVAGQQHSDTHTVIDHAHPHCTSRELYKGILDGKSRGVFVGRILVREGASKTDAHQTNKNLLLSREALVDSVPQLEILASDV